MQILKYQLDLKAMMSPGGHLIRLNETANILTVQEQSGHLVMWVAIDRKSKPLGVSVFAYATGDELPELYGSYLSTVQDRNGFVFHVFYKTNPLINYLPG